MILVTSLLGTLFPIVTIRVRRLRDFVPAAFFQFAKWVWSTKTLDQAKPRNDGLTDPVFPPLVMSCARFFGSGVILSTAIIHLLQPAAIDELGPTNTIAYGGCIANEWNDYPYAVFIFPPTLVQ